MSSPQPSPPTGTDPAPGTCARIRRLITAFADDRLERAQARELRAHVAACPSCRADYVETLTSIGRLGHALGRSPAGLEGPGPVARARRRSYLRVEPEVAPVRRWRSLIVLGVCALLLLGLSIPRRRERSLLVERCAGAFLAGGKLLSEAHPRGELERGGWCLLEGEASARLSGSRGSLELSAGARLLLEDPAGMRLRLEDGRAQIDGSAVLTHALGVVDVEQGRAVVTARAASLEVQCERGRLRVTSAGGDLRLLPGESARVTRSAGVQRSAAE